MASTPKSGNKGPKRGRTPAKPATIDLKAKDVSAASDNKKDEQTANQPEKKADEVKSAAPEQKFGRNASAKAATEKAKPSVNPQSRTSSKTADNTEQAAKSDRKPNDAETENSFMPSMPGDLKSGLGPGLIGAAAAVLILGLIGQFSFAPQIPVIGSLYQDNSGSSETLAQVVALNNRVEELSSQRDGEGAEAAGSYSELSDKIAEIENTLVSNNANNPDGQVAVLREELAELRSRLDEMASPSPGPSAGGNTAQPGTALETRIAGIEEKIISLGQTDGVFANRKIEELSSELGSVRQEVVDNEGKINELNNLAQTLEAKIDRIAISSDSARTIAVTGIGTALQRDESLIGPITSLEALGVQSEELRQLSELARDGIPSQSELQSELDNIQFEVQNPSNPGEDSSITSRLLANARSLVTVRTSGPREGDSPAAILSRVDANLAKDDLGAVIAEWKKLPADVTDSHNDWIAKVEKRAEAFALYKTLSDKTSDPSG